jgi:hemoglobin
VRPKIQVPRQMRARALYWVRIELSGRGPVWHCVVDRPPIACCDLALADVGLTSNDVLRRVPHDYFAWATTTTISRYHESADDVPNGLSIPRWS